MIQRVSVGQMCAELQAVPWTAYRLFQFIVLISQWTLLKVWSLNQDNELKVDRLLCLEVTRHEMLKVMKCHGQGGAQEWRHNKVRTLSFTMMKNMAFKL